MTMLLSEIARMPIRRKVQGAFLVLSALLLLTLVSVPFSRNAIIIDVQSESPGKLQVYFDQGAGPTEALSLHRRYTSGFSRVEFPLPPGETQAVRIDPEASAREITLSGIGVRGFSRPIEWLALADQLPTGHEMDAIDDGTPGGTTFAIAEGATDPQITVPLIHPVASHEGISEKAWSRLWIFFWASVLIAIALQFVRRPLPTLGLSLIVLGLCAAMALMSFTQHSVHPDELLHDADASYFQRHWTPPALDAPDLVTSYKSSPYGVSYLVEWNVVYLLAAKSSRVFSELGASAILSYRMFNVALFGLMLAALVYIRAPRGSFIPLLLTPQLWYVFSYFNGDALPFAVAMIATTVALSPNGRLAAFISGKTQLDWPLIAHSLLFVTCFGLLIISKKNYWPVAVFIVVSMAAMALRSRARVALALMALFIVAVWGNTAGAALVKEFGSHLAWVSLAVVLAALIACLLEAWRVLKDVLLRRALLRIGALLCLSLLVALPWITVDMLKNSGGPGKIAVAEQMRERYAEPAFKISVANAMSVQQSSFKLQAKGMPMAALLDAPKEWHVGTFHSFFGAYGYMEYFNSEAGYRFIGCLALATLLLAMIWGQLTGRLTASQSIISVGCATALVGASFLHSWTYDFQPQGRYVLGILIMAVPIFQWVGESDRSRVVFTALVLCVAVTSLYSYVTFGFPYLT
jgi:hypothetical protein